MADSRPGFMVYFRDWAPLKMLDDSQFRALFNAAFDYAASGKETPIHDPVVDLAFKMLCPRIEDDERRYQDKVEKARAAARRGVEIRSERERTTANASGRKQPSKKKFSTEDQPKNTTEDSLSPPSLSEVEVEAKRAGLHVDGVQFLADCEADGWLDGKGEPVRDWRRYLRGYAARFGGAQKHPSAPDYEQRQYSQSGLSALSDANFETAASALKEGDAE